MNNICLEGCEIKVILFLNLNHIEMDRLMANGFISYLILNLFRFLL